MPTSVMPKGVEHAESAPEHALSAAGMPTSVMPKGVEHAPHARYCANHAHLCDAERR